MNLGLLLVQDNFSAHVARLTLEELESRGNLTIFWPAFSPDLNPIEAIWDIMKKWVQLHHDNEDKLSYERLSQKVRKTYDAVTPNQLDELINSVNDRCQSRYAKYLKNPIDSISPCNNPCHVLH